MPPSLRTTLQASNTSLEVVSDKPLSVGWNVSRPPSIPKIDIIRRDDPLRRDVSLTLSTAVLKGTVNDATTFPTPSKSHGSYHWAFERGLSAALIPILGGAMVTSGTAHVSGMISVRRCSLEAINRAATETQEQLPG